jgi:transcriptional regulator with XRE-family HTH domain
MQGARLVGRDAGRLALTIGASVRDERRRRHITLRELSVSTGLSKSCIHDVECGEQASLPAYVTIARGLGLRVEFALADPRRKTGSQEGQADVVHAAMGEAQAERLRTRGFQVRLDEPYRHYQFAGRADVVAWHEDSAALFHIENKTEIDDVQAAFGSFNAKRAYLGAELAERLGVGKWRSETYVVCALWSADVLRTVRRHRSSAEAVWPDRPDAFEAWWSGLALRASRRSILVLFDPAEGVHSDRRRWVGLADLDGQRPRYRDYADAAAACRRHSRSTAHA